MARRKRVKGVLVSLYLDKQDLEYLKELAIKERTSLSSIIRKMIKRYIDEYNSKMIEELSSVMVEVTFMRDYEHFKVGSMAVLPRSQAEELIQKGIVKLGEGFA